MLFEYNYSNDGNLAPIIYIKLSINDRIEINKLVEKTFAAIISESKSNSMSALEVLQQAQYATKLSNENVAAVHLKQAIVSELIENRILNTMWNLENCVKNDE